MLRDQGDDLQDVRNATEEIEKRNMALTCISIIQTLVSRPVVKDMANQALISVENTL